MEVVQEEKQNLEEECKTLKELQEESQLQLQVCRNTSNDFVKNVSAACTGKGDYSREGTSNIKIPRGRKV